MPQSLITLNDLKVGQIFKWDDPDSSFINILIKPGTYQQLHPVGPYEKMGLPSFEFSPKSGGMLNVIPLKATKELFDVPNQDT
jgi:hypothetical protein